MNSQERSKFKRQTKVKRSLDLHLPLILPDLEVHLQLHLQLQPLLKLLWMSSTSPGVQPKSQAVFLPANFSVWLNTGSTLTTSYKMALICVRKFIPKVGRNSSLG